MYLFERLLALLKLLLLLLKLLLLKLQQTTDDGSTVIYIKNISPSETNDLREALEKIGSVKNYLPLLNKVKNTPVHTFDYEDLNKKDIVVLSSLIFHVYACLF